MSPVAVAVAVAIAINTTITGQGWWALVKW